MHRTASARTTLERIVPLARDTLRSDASTSAARPRSRRRLTTAADRAKIDCLPFVLDREAAVSSMLGVVTGHSLTQAAHSRGAVPAMWALAKAVATGKAGGRFALVRCQAIYIPIWRVDIAARWLASTAFLAGVKAGATPDDDTPAGRFARLMTAAARVPVNVRTSCFSLPGHSWKPLSQLPLHLPIEDDGELALESYDTSKHGRTKNGEEVMVLPFSQSPFGLLDRVRDYCQSHSPSSDELRKGRKVELQDFLDGKDSLPAPIANAPADEADNEEIDLDARPTVSTLQRLLSRMRPLDFAAPMYAAYPILIPAYLGEFKERAVPQRSMSLEEDADAASEEGPRVTAIALAHHSDIKVRGITGGMSNVYSSTALFNGEHWLPRTSPMPTIIAGVPTEPAPEFNALFDGAMTLAPQYMDREAGLDHPRAMSFNAHHQINQVFAEEEQNLAAPFAGTAEMETDDQSEEAYEKAVADRDEKIEFIRPDWLRKVNEAGH